jgi:hypothetical protein
MSKKRKRKEVEFPYKFGCLLLLVGISGGVLRRPQGV